jgi:hypothetical protein
MKYSVRELYILVGMSIGAGGAMFLGHLFGTVTIILWFVAISITGLLYSIFASVVD